MNIRRGISRIYAVFCGLVLIGLVFGIFGTWPDKDQASWSYKYQIEQRIAGSLNMPAYEVKLPGNTSKETVELMCLKKEVLVYMYEDICSAYEQDMKHFWKHIALHLAQWFAGMAATALVMYAISRASGWIADGFSSK